MAKNFDEVRNELRVCGPPESVALVGELVSSASSWLHAIDPPSYPLDTPVHEAVTWERAHWSCTDSTLGEPVFDEDGTSFTAALVSSYGPPCAVMAQLANRIPEVTVEHRSASLLSDHCSLLVFSGPFDRPRDFAARWSYTDGMREALSTWFDTSGLTSTEMRSLARRLHGDAAARVYDAVATYNPETAVTVLDDLHGVAPDASHPTLRLAHRRRAADVLSALDVDGDDLDTAARLIGGHAVEQNGAVLLDAARNLGGLPRLLAELAWPTTDAAEVAEAVSRPQARRTLAGLSPPQVDAVADTVAAMRRRQRALSLHASDLLDAAVATV